VPQYGAQFLFKTEDAIGRCIYKTGTYEKNLTDFVTQNIPFEENEVFIDIGANIGWYSIVMSKVLPASCKIFSFEPDPLNLEILQKNKEQNLCENIEIVPKALGKTAAQSTLYLYPDKNRGRHSMIALEQNQEKISIEVASLDDFLMDRKIDFTRIKFLKIDVEGFELPALQGAMKTLENVSYVLMEYSPEIMETGGYSPQALLDLMLNAKFEAHKIKAGKLERIPDKDLRGIRLQTDLLWTKKF